MSDADENDVLKRLRDVRKRLQESIDDGGKVVEAQEKPATPSVTGGSQSISSSSGPSTEIKKGPKLYKTKTDDIKKISDKKFKQTTGGVSRKRMAAIQRRIKATSESRKRMSVGRKTILLIGIMLFSLPYFIMNTLALATCRFNFDAFGIRYGGTPGSIVITLPVTNPSFVPAELGKLSMELYNERSGEVVGRILTDYKRTIEPYQTVVLQLEVALNSSTAGNWLEDLFNSLQLRMSVRNFKYNGVKLLDKVELPALDMSEMIADLTSGLDLGSMFGTTIKPTASNVKNLWSMASQESLSSANYNGIPQAGQFMEVDCQDLSFGLLDLGIEETDKAFRVRADLAFKVPQIDGFELGPVRITNFRTSIYGPSVLNSTEPADYKSEIARLTTYTDGLYEFDDCGVKRDTKYAVEVNFGGISFAAARFELFKDDLGGLKTHPSSYLNFSDAAAVKKFEQDNRHKLPLWYFLQNLLANQMIDIVIGIEELSVEIFGIAVNNITLPKDIARLQLKTTKPIFDLDEMLGSLGNKPLTLGTGISYLTQTIGSAGLATPRPSQESFNLDVFDDLEVEINTDELLSSIKETKDSLSLGLGIALNNTFLDIHLGLENVSLAIANEVDGVTRGFVLAKIGSPGGDFVYINGTGYKNMGSMIEVNLNLSIYKNNETMPHVQKFLRDLLQDFKIEGKAIASIGKLILFAQNYTFKGLSISLDIGPLTESLDISSILSGAIKDAMEGLSEDLAGTNNAMSNLKFYNPLSAPAEFLTSLAFGSPLFSSMTGINFPNAYIITEDGKKITSPKAAQELLIDINENLESVKVRVVYPGLELGEGTLPIHVGLGPATIKLQTNSSNDYGLWKTLISLQLENYIAIGPEASKFDVIATLEIFQGGTLCQFLDSIFVRKEGPSFDLKLDAVLNLNLSGIFLDNVHLQLEVPGINMHIQLQGLIDSLLGPSEDATAKSIPSIGPMKEIVDDMEAVWDGNFDSLPFMSQDFDISQHFKTGDFVLKSITETGWPALNGTLTVDLSIQLYNGFMTLELVEPEIRISSKNGLPLIELQILNDPPALPHKKFVTLNLRIIITKSQDLQDFITNLLYDGSISGNLFARLGLKIFGCKIGPIQLSMPIEELLGVFGLDLAELFLAMIPFNEKTLRDSPRASADMIDMFGDFGIAYVTTRDPNTFGESVREPVGIVNVGPQNYTDPMMTFHLGLALRPNYNLSLYLDLSLCDKGIYTKILNSPSGNKEDAYKYSKIAHVTTTPGVIYANNTYTPDNDFAAIRAKYKNDVTEDNYMFYIDPDKPFYNTASGNNTGIKGLYYAQEYYSNKTAKYRPYGTGDKLNNPMGTFSMADISLSLYNLSFGSWQTQYPKQYWRALGGPYFPPQVFGREYGGYPNHRISYHPHYAPLANILSSVDAVMSGDFGGLLSNIQIVGTISINVFSLNISIDTDSPLVSSLLSSLLMESLDSVYDEYRTALNPWRGKQTPEVAYANRLQRISQYDDPSIPRYANMPFQSGFSTSLMKLDMESVIDDYPLLGLVARYNHAFAPSIAGLSYDGSVRSIQSSRYMGTNICPYNDPNIPIDYSTDPDKPRWNLRMDYKQGVKRNPLDTSRSNEENFVKDVYYEQYKWVVQGWADARKQMNPFFESENLSTFKFGTSAGQQQYSYDLIEDSYDWALRWQNDKQRRTPSFVGIFSAAVIPAFNLGILSMYANAWQEDPVQRGTRGVGLAPIGYAWVNQSIFPKTLAQAGGNNDFWKQSPVYGDNGEVPQDCNWAMLNLRLFESISTRNFFNDLIGDINNLNFNLYLDLTINASLFGYEAYNLAVGGLGTGKAGKFAARSTANLIDQATGQVWGVFQPNGTLAPPVGLEETFEWLPKEFLPQFPEDSNVLPVDLGSIIDLNGILNSLLSSFVIDDILTGITFRLNLAINTPLYLSAFLTYLEGTIVGNWDDKRFLTDDNPYNVTATYPNPLSWDTVVSLTRAVGDSNTGALWTEVDAHFDPTSTTSTIPGLPSSLNGKNRDPYNYGGNPLGMWPSAGEIGPDYWKKYEYQTQVQYGESIILPPITLTITWDLLGKVLGIMNDISLLTVAGIAAWAAITGKDIVKAIGEYMLPKLPYHLWICILQNEYEMYQLMDEIPGRPGVPNNETSPLGAAIHALLPPALGYDFKINLPYDILFMNLMAMLRPLLGEDKNLYDSKGNYKPAYKTYPALPSV